MGLIVIRNHHGKNDLALVMIKVSVLALVMVMALVMILIFHMDAGTDNHTVTGNENHHDMLVDVILIMVVRRLNKQNKHTNTT